MDKKTRTIYFYDIYVSTHVIYDNIDNPSQVPIKECLEIISKTNPKGKHYSYSKNTLHYEISEWHFDSKANQYIVLINKSDGNSADPTFSDVPKKTRRVVAKNVGEGLEHSSHIIIQLDDAKPHKALLLLEKGALSGSGNIESIFHRLLSDAKKHHPSFFLQNHPSGIHDQNGKLEKIKVRYDFHVEGHLSSSFISDLQAGTLSEILLISESEEDTPIDTNGRYLKKSTMESIKVNPKKDFTIQSLKSLLKGESKDYEKARIRFTDKNKIDRNIEINTENFSEVNYVKRSKVSFLLDLPSSSEKENKTITDEMKKLI